jgi:Pyruvate/2-oxoacid:ferredoxin oxidoreductase delta subunit
MECTNCGAYLGDRQTFDDHDPADDLDEYYCAGCQTEEEVLTKRHDD